MVPLTGTCVKRDETVVLCQLSATRNVMIRLRVREIAEQKKISMTRLSRIADVNYKTVQAIFSDPYRDVAYRTLDKIAKALGVTVPDLIEDVPDEGKS